MSRRALIIGLGQCFSLWPGASRSMCTIVAGQATGLSTATAAEFSFLLALPTLGAATVYEGLKARHELSASVGGPQLWVGMLVSFFVAWGVIAVFIRYLQRRGLEPFGYYRIVLSALVLWLEPDAIVEHLIAGAAAGGFFLVAVLAYPRGMGVGDIKLAAVLGLFLGRAVGPAIFIALISGTLVGALIMARKGVAEGRKTAVPFGPFLALGGVVALFAGDAMVDWYLATFS